MLQFGDLSKMLTIKKLPYLKIVITLLGLNLATGLLVIFLQNNLPPEVPLLYGRAYGEKQLVDSIWLIIPSITAVLAILINTAVSCFIKEKLLQQILITTSIVATILALITTIKIILLVGNI